MIDQRIPPHSIEAEQSLLGSLLIDKDAVIKIVELVRTDDFYKDTHGMIFESMMELWNKREPIDILSLGNKLEEKKQLELVGGRGYVISLSSMVPTSSHVAHYATIVQKKATLRRLISAASDITAFGFQEDEEVTDILDKSEQRLFAISQKYQKQAFVPIREVLSDAFERMDALHNNKGELRGITSGYKEMDNMLAGFQRSDLIILAARPSVGKTSLALDIARNAAVRGKAAVGIFSLEMSKEQLVDRLLCAEARVDSWKMRTGKLSSQGENNDFSRIGDAMGVLSEAKIYIDDSSSANVMEIRSKCRRLQMEHGLDMVIIDYLQLMESARQRAGDNRVQEVSEISRGLKGIARELNVPVIALSQLARAVEARSPAIPRLSDLRESGSIEQDADIVMFLYRKAKDGNFFNLPEEEKHLADIIVSKHRNGPVGQVTLYFNEDMATFQNLETRLVSQPF